MYITPLDRLIIYLKQFGFLHKPLAIGISLEILILTFAIRSFTES